MATDKRVECALNTYIHTYIHMCIILCKPLYQVLCIHRHRLFVRWIIIIVKFSLFSALCCQRLHEFHNRKRAHTIQTRKIMAWVIETMAHICICAPFTSITCPLFIMYIGTFFFKCCTQSHNTSMNEKKRQTKVSGLRVYYLKL